MFIIFQYFIRPRTVMITKSAFVTMFKTSETKDTYSVNYEGRNLGRNWINYVKARLIFFDLLARKHDILYFMTQQFDSSCVFTF